MEATERRKKHRRLWLYGAASLTAAILLRRALAALCVQLLAASLLMLLALPLCRRLETRMKSGPAAALSLLLLAGAAIAVLLLLLPPIARQLQQLTKALPTLLDWASEKWQTLSQWLARRGVDAAPARDALFTQLTGKAGDWLGRIMERITHLASGLGKVLLSPLLAFYLLRDRHSIGAGLLLLLPVKHRMQGARAAREMRRETAAYLRGQLLLSLSVAGLTSLGLLLTGTPAYLLLGCLMGLMELLPYAGPIIAGVPAVLLSLQSGLTPALWTLLVLLAVQQLEGAILSPRLLAGATQLHPMTVLLLISAGGILFGPAGMLLAVPLVTAARGFLRGWYA